MFLCETYRKCNQGVFMQEFLRRTWASINLDALNKNFCAIRNATNPCVKIMSVIKADAYGHGALPVQMS